MDSQFANGHRVEKIYEERLSQLENQLAQKNDEISTLKTTLNDVLRRLQTLESQAALLKNYSSPARPSSQNKTPSQSKSLNAAKNATKSDTVKRSSNSPLVNDSLNSKHLIKELQNNSKPNSSKQHGIKDQLPHRKFSFNKENGIVKFYLRGRPINLVMPYANLQSDTNDFKFDTEARLEAPHSTLKLDWVYGYRGKDCRSNIHYLASNEIVYFIAAVAILYNHETQTQRHYLEHNDDIKALTIHPNRAIVASGQVASHDKKEGRPHVRIWNAQTLHTLKTLGSSSSDFINSICCLSFSKHDMGNYLAIIDEGNDRTLSVWDWQKSERVAKAKCYTDLIFGLEFSPNVNNLLVTCGKQHVTFWNFDSQSSSNLTKRMGTFESSEHEFAKPKFILNIAFNSNDEVLTGDSEGNILFWNAREAKIVRCIRKAHEGGVFLAHVLNEQIFFSGGKDGQLIEWSFSNLEKTGRSIQLPEVYGGCRALCISNNNTTNDIFLGSTRNCLLRVNLDANLIEQVTCGHSDELWGLSALNHPQSKAFGYFLTCGNDRYLSMWNAIEHRHEWSVQFDEKLHSICSHPSLKLVAVGSKTCKFFIFDLEKRETVYTGQTDSSEQIECVQYSPNGQLLACASRDNTIYVHIVSSENGLSCTRAGKFSGHSSFITHIDWSNDSRFLMSNSGDYEVLYWDTKTFKQLINIDEIRKIEWRTHSCTLNFNTIGIWNSKSILNETTETATTSIDGTDINACCASNLKSVLVSVDDFGQVNLFKYPCNTFSAEKKTYKGHSSHVTNVTFLNNNLDNCVITTGGKDCAIFQWSLIEHNDENI